MNECQGHSLMQLVQHTTRVKVHLLNHNLDTTEFIKGLTIKPQRNTAEPIMTSEVQ